MGISAGPTRSSPGNGSTTSPTTSAARRAADDPLSPSSTVLVTATRTCRVAVDVLAVERLFDYAVPEALAGVVGVGMIVRVNLGGRPGPGRGGRKRRRLRRPPRKTRP